MIATVKYLKAWDVGKRKDLMGVSQEDRRSMLSEDTSVRCGEKTLLRAAPEWIQVPCNLL